MASASVQQPVRFDEPGGERFRRRRRSLYVTSTVVLSMVVLLAFAEALFGLPVYGVDHDERTATVNGTELTVRYPRLTRGQLDSQLTVTVRRQSGFDGPVTVEVTSAYLAEFTTRRVTPEPTSETDHGDAVAFTFDTPSVNSLVVQWDLGARPTGWFSSVAGRATVLIASEPPATVTFRSQLRP